MGAMLGRIEQSQKNLQKKKELEDIYLRPLKK